MSEQHTPEPWRTDAKGGFPQDVHDADDNLVAACSEANFGDANARRIVVCVNACAGITTENLEDNVSVKELAHRYNKTIRQRDELLEHLENLLFWDNGKPEFEEARAAIASVKEQP